MIAFDSHRSHSADVTHESLGRRGFASGGPVRSGFPSGRRDCGPGSRRTVRCSCQIAIVESDRIVIHAILDLRQHPKKIQERCSQFDDRQSEYHNI